MFDYFKGLVADKRKTSKGCFVSFEVSGVGYLLEITERDLLNISEETKELVMNEMKRRFKPEFLNRVDDTIVFNQLKEEDTLEIVNIMLKDTIKRLKEKNIDLIYDEDLNKFLVTKNKNLEFGARPLRGIINREIVDKLSDELLKGEIKVGDKLKVECKEEGLIFSHR